VTEISDRYRTRAAGFNARVEAVPDQGWEQPSPCEGWTARDVVRHVVDTSTMFLGFIDDPPPGGPSVDDDPAGAWHAARDAIQGALDDPARAAKEYDGIFGKQTFEASVDRFLSADALIHTWDLARATGLDETLDPDDVRGMLDQLQAMEAQVGDAMRTSGAFGPKIDPPPDADDQARLLAFVGRRA
jgi:uncharacterized protein (TIGR03086 family)